MNCARETSFKKQAKVIADGMLGVSTASTLARCCRHSSPVLDYGAGAWLVACVREPQ